MADQKCTDIDWQDARIFVALARHGSLSAAARMLSVNHATIARRLRSLEASLGEKLVERRPEGYILTPAGTHALEVAGDMEQAAQILGRGIGDGTPTGLIRINASPGLSAGFLVSRLPTLAIRYPRLDIDLAPALRSISLERHEADIAIRFGKPKDGDVRARLLTTVGFNEADTYIPSAAWMARQFPRARVAFRTKDHLLQAVAARSGVGLALIPHYIGRGTPTLRACDLGAVPPSRDVFLLTRSRDRKTSAIQIITDEVAGMFEQEHDLFAP